MAERHAIPIDPRVADARASVAKALQLLDDAALVLPAGILDHAIHALDALPPAIWLVSVAASYS